MQPCHPTLVKGWMRSKSLLNYTVFCMFVFHLSISSFIFPVIRSVVDLKKQKSFRWAQISGTTTINLLFLKDGNWGLLVLKMHGNLRESWNVRLLTQCWSLCLRNEIAALTRLLPRPPLTGIIHEVSGNGKTKLRCHVVSPGCKSHICLLILCFPEKTDLSFSLSDTFSRTLSVPYNACVHAATAEL